MSTTAPAPAGGGIGLSISGPTAWIAIDNPAKRNAMTSRMWLSLPDAVATAEADPAVRVLIVHGAGDNFCAGADIDELTAIRGVPAGEGAHDPDQLVVRAEAALINCRKPTIALVDGFCIGGGTQIANACDLRIASTRARYGITPSKIGIVYPATSLSRLTQLIGPSSAKWLLYSGDLIDADRALRIGVLDELVEAEHLHRRVSDFAALLAERSSLTQVAAKDIIDRAACAEPIEERGVYWHRIAADSPDEAEGIAAFQQKRKPRFTWNMDMLKKTGATGISTSE